MNRNRKRHIYFLSIITVIGASIYFIAQDHESQYTSFIEVEDPKPFKKTASLVLKSLKPVKREVASDNGRTGGIVSTPSPYRPGLRAKKPRLIHGQSLMSDPEIKSRITGVAFTSQSRKYLFVEDLYAIAEDKYNSAIHTPKGKFFGKRVVISNNLNVDEYDTVVINQDTENAVIFTGKLKIKLSNVDLARSLVERINNKLGNNQFDPELDYEFENIDVITYVFKDYAETMSFYNTAKLEDYSDVILRINIDLIEWQRTE